MSRNNNTKNTNTKNTKSVSKPFCKICFDAGKPESQYTSHYIRKTTDPNSAITCPILLATECRYCHQMGHTISRCTLREQNNRARDAPAQAPEQAPRQVQASSTRPAPRPAAVAAPVARQSNSRFAALDDDEEDAVSASVTVPASATIAPAPLSSTTQPVNLFPSLSAKVAPIASNSGRVSYSSAFKSSDAPSSWKLRIVPTVEVEEVIEEYDSDDDEVYEKTVTVSVPASTVPAPAASSPASSPTAKPKVVFSCLDIFNKSLSKKVAPLKKLNTYAENKVEPEEYFVQEEDKLDYATERYLAKFEVKKPTYAEKINPVLSRSYHYDNPYYNYDW